MCSYEFKTCSVLVIISYETIKNKKNKNLQFEVLVLMNLIKACSVLDVLMNLVKACSVSGINSYKFSKSVFSFRYQFL